MKHPILHSITLAIDGINTELLKLRSTFAYLGYSLGGRYHWIDTAGNRHSVRSRKSVAKHVRRIKSSAMQTKESA